MGLFYLPCLINENALAVSVTAELVSERQMLGTMLMFALLSGYLIFVSLVQHSRSLDALEVITSLTSNGKIEANFQVLADDVRTRLNSIGIWTLPVLLLAAMWGVYQNEGVVQIMWFSQRFLFVDFVFIFGGCVVWLLIVIVLCWRIPVSISLARLSRYAPINLYAMQELRPLSRISTTDVLIVAGAMAFMPLQALDAEFRLVNYFAGSVVGLLSALVLFFLPLLGIRENIMAEKTKRLNTLQTELRTIHVHDTQHLELVSAHIERIAAIPNWPLDLRLVARAFSYLIIPPMAWIAAALVENFVDKL